MKTLFGRITLIFIDLMLIVNLIMVFNQNFAFIQEVQVNWSSDYYFGSQSLWNWLNDMPSSLNVSFLTNSFTEWVNYIRGSEAFEQTDAWNTIAKFVESYAMALLYPFIFLWRLTLNSFEYIQWFIKLFIGYYNVRVQNTFDPWADIIDTSDLDITYYLSNVANVLY